MGSPFYYRVQVGWIKDGKIGSWDNCQIYGFKPGGIGESSWWESIKSLSDLRNIMIGSDGARAVTVCTHTMDAPRYLESRDITRFTINVVEAPTYRNIDINHYVPPGPDKTLAQISFPSMVSSSKVGMARDLMKMSCEPLPNQLFAVALDFHNTMDGPTFKLTT